MGEKQIDINFLYSLNIEEWFNLKTSKDFINNRIKKLYQKLELIRDKHHKNLEKNINKIKRGDELSSGILKVVKIYVAIKRKIQPGDKMSGRHGNKGVISTIIPIEDMPYMSNGE